MPLAAAAAAAATTAAAAVAAAAFHGTSSLGSKDWAIGDFSFFEGRAVLGPVCLRSATACLRRGSLLLDGHHACTCRGAAAVRSAAAAFPAASVS